MANKLNVDLIYPIGSIYMSVNNTNPSILFGGTWEQLKDRFLLGSGDTYTAGNTGGEATHKLVENELPKHRFRFTSARQYGTGSATDNSSKLGRTQSNADGVSDYYTDYIGNNQAHNNMPPYLVVYMWKRIS